MVQLTYSGQWTADSLSEQAQISDLQAFTVEQSLYLVSTSGAYGELAVWQWTDSGLVLRDTQALTGTSALAAPGGLAVFEAAGQSAFYSFGGAGQGLSGYEITTSGQIRSLGDQGAGALTLETVIEVPTATGVQVFGAGRNTDGLITWAGGASGLTGKTVLPAGQAGSGTEAPDMAALSQDGSDFVLTVDPTGNALHAWRIAEDGTAVLSDSISPVDGLWVSSPVAVETVTMAGQGYAIVGASGSASLSVVQLGPQGQLWVTDHVIDDRNTRFDDVSVLETVSVGDRVFVLASGADDGITLMTLLPGGRLVSLDTLASETGAVLEDITSIEAVVTTDGLSVFVAAEGFEGVAALTVALDETGAYLTGTEGRDRLDGDGRADVIEGGGGNDQIFGHGGDDIIDGGAGSDTLFGGAGEDIFIFSADGARDRIADFELGVDRIDLSAMGRVYSLDALEFRTLSGGVRITFNGEQLDVMAGSPLSKSDFTLEMLFDMAHSPVAPLPATAQHLTGADSDDLLVGDSADDRLEGEGGHDVLQGGAGDDLLLAEALREGFDTASAQVVRLFQTALDRAPDAGGHLSWTAKLQSGLSGEKAAAGFVASREFAQKYGDTDDTEFVALLFQNVLGRQPAQAGLDAWVNALQAGMSRAEAVWRFSETAELADKMLPTTLDYSFAALQADMVDEVFRLFQATLGRTPGESGLISWASQLASGASVEQVAAGFVNSAEFQSVYGDASNAEFVTLLYGNVLNRAPDAGGLTGWTNALEAGMSRAEVVARFAQSAEFVTKSQPALVSFMRAQMGDDTLSGGAGDDTLLGGTGADSFVFDATDSGQDRVVDLEAWDQVVIENAPFADTGDLFAALRQSGADVVLELGAGSVVFENTELDDLTQDMFLLG